MLSTTQWIANTYLYYLNSKLYIELYKWFTEIFCYVLYIQKQNTPLHRAACFGHCDVVRILMEHKADMHSLNEVHMYACSYSCLLILDVNSS